MTLETDSFICLEVEDVLKQSEIKKNDFSTTVREFRMCEKSSCLLEWMYNKLKNNQSILVYLVLDKKKTFPVFEGEIKRII